MTLTFAKRALQFGAGNIGRGLIGVLLRQSNYQVVFTDIDEPLIELINRKRKYVVRMRGSEGEKRVNVNEVEAINAREETKVVQEISIASLITTAVGPKGLEEIGPVISKGLQRRARLDMQMPLNIIACENLINNSKVLQKYVLGSLSTTYRPYVENMVGFPSCVVDRIVPSSGNSQKKYESLSVLVEENFQFVVDGHGVIGPPPSIQGMILTDNIDAYVEQKFFGLNTAHAIAAYLGYLKGYEFIHEAMRDRLVRRVVSGAMEECSAVLVSRHHFNPIEQERYATGTMKRFENENLRDPIVRVAREPKRKLAPTDRLVRPVELAFGLEVVPENLATGIAAALLYDHPGDGEAKELSRLLQDQGIDHVLGKVCGLEPNSRAAQLVRARIKGLEEQNRGLTNTPASGKKAK